ncbi:uncharacterized protein [Panulirus ornatus]|uniref:uncharacterized protein n=1 Tax=Panulirus ornatus TaxID=150431 RepID=UPI003A8B7E5F
MTSHNTNNPWRFQPFTTPEGCPPCEKILRLPAVPYLYTCPESDTAVSEPSGLDAEIRNANDSLPTRVLETPQFETTTNAYIEEFKFKNEVEIGPEDDLLNAADDFICESTEEDGLSILGVLKQDWLTSLGSEQENFSSKEFTRSDVFHSLQSTRKDENDRLAKHYAVASVNSQNQDGLLPVKWHNDTRVTKIDRLARNDITEHEGKITTEVATYQRKEQVSTDGEETRSKSLSLSKDDGFVDGDTEVDNIVSSDLDDPDPEGEVLVHGDSSTKDSSPRSDMKWIPEEIQSFINRSNKLKIAHTSSDSVFVINPAFFVNQEKQSMDCEADLIISPVFVTINMSAVKLIVHGKVFEETDIRNIPESLDILKKVENKFIQNQYLYCPGVSETYIHACLSMGINIPINTFDKFMYCGRVSYHDKFCEKFYRKSNSVSMSKVHGLAYTCRCCNHKIYYYRSRYRSKKLGLMRLNVCRTKRTNPSPNSYAQAFAKYPGNTSVNRNIKQKYIEWRDVDILKLSENMKEKSFSLNSKQNKDFLEVLTKLKHEPAVKEILKRNAREASDSRKWAAQIVWDGDVKKATYLTQQMHPAGVKEQEPQAKMDKEDGNRFEKEASNRWSMITFRIALAVYMRNRDSYKSLESFRILELPSLPPNHEYSLEVKNNPTSHLQYIAQQAEQYFTICREYKADGRLPCLGEGALIIDQMKVISKVVWYGVHESLVGHDLSEEELMNLSDIFNKAPEPKMPRPDEFVLQTVWRDMCYNLDIIGPYFHLSHNVKGQQLANYLLWTIKSFNDFRLKTIAIVCDTATMNAACLRGSLGEGGPLGVGNDDTYEINPTFPNPFDPSLQISWIVCPNHMVINMMNALHSSQRDGSKDFQYGGISFGWKPLEFLLENDIEMENNEAKISPLLRKSYIERRHTIKFQYALCPSRILQKPEVIDALEKEIQETTNEDTKQKMQKTWEFLTATNKIFENGLLSHLGVSSTSEKPVTNIMEGYQWFCDWLKEVHSTADFQVRNPRQKEFLSWQTWEGLQLSVHGFKSLCKSFHSRHPDRSIIPVRLNGSAVDAIFSQVKHYCGTGKGKSKVSALSYPAGLTATKLNTQLRRKHKRSDSVSTAKKLKES